MLPRGFHILFCIVAFTFLLSTSARAETELVEWLSFTVPGLTGAIEKIEFADINGDNFAEVLASDGQFVVLSFVSSAEPVLRLDIDSFYNEAGIANWNPLWAGMALLLADVNRDSLTDCTILASPSSGMGGAETRYLVLFYDDVRSLPTPATALDFTLESTLGIGMLDAVDLNGDGHDNLVLSVDSSVWDDDYAIFWFSDHSYGKTLIYHSFPDSMQHSMARLISNINVGLHDPGDLNLATGVTWSWQDPPTLGPWEESSKHLLSLDTVGAVIAGKGEVGPSRCSGSHDYQYKDHLVAKWIGNLDPPNTLLNVICTFDWSSRCDLYFPEADSSSGNQIILYRVHNTDSLAEVCRADTYGRRFENFIAHPTFPDQFFAMAGDTLMRFDADDGSLLKQYDPLPEGMKFWEYPYNDGEPYLVVVNVDTVTYYHFDVATDVTGEPDNSALPSTFTLGQPYPNPFNPTVTLPITVSRKGQLKVEVYNPLGQKVDVLFEGVVSSGEMILDWDAGDFASGIYLFKATLGDVTKTAKAVLLK